MKNVLMYVSVAVLFFAAGALFNAAVHPGPSLVGYGCSDAKGAVYAYEEDHMPSCATILKR